MKEKRGVININELYFYIFLGVTVPFLGTTVGAALVFFLRRKINVATQISIEGISAGIMVAASVWSLLIPAIELSEKRGQSPLLMTCLGLLFGVVIFIAGERILARGGENRRICERYGKSFLPCLAVALHNFPEGMAVGASFAEALYSGDGGALSAAMALAIGIAVQNLPEGAVVSVPLYSEGMKKRRAFLLGSASGIVEPIGAVGTIIAAKIAVPILPFLLGAAAGAMIFAVLDCIFEREYRECDRWAKAVFSLCFSLGFILMMSLDVVLG